MGNDLGLTKVSNIYIYLQVYYHYYIYLQVYYHY